MAVYSRPLEIKVGSKVGQILVEYGDSTGSHYIKIQLEGLLFLTKDRVTEDELSKIFLWEKGKENPLEKLGVDHIVTTTGSRYKLKPGVKIIGVYKVKPDTKIKHFEGKPPVEEINPEAELANYLALLEKVAD
jgi:hypothetical protein